MSEKIHSGTYYYLTDEDRDQITKYFNERDLEELIGYCSVLAQVASYHTWRNAGLYLKDVGEEKFFRDCKNYGHTFDCDPTFAINECGDRYEKWIPLTKDQKIRLKGLEDNII